MSERDGRLSAYDQLLSDREMQYGPARGRLSVSLDLLTDAVILAGTHSAYCRHRRDSAETNTDMQNLQNLLTDVKMMVQDVMQTLERDRDEGADRGV